MAALNQASGRNPSRAIFSKGWRSQYALSRPASRSGRFIKADGRFIKAGNNGRFIKACQSND